MKAVVLSDEAYAYLVECFKRNAESGVAVEELEIAAKTWYSLKEGTKDIDVSKLATVVAEGDKHGSE